MPRRSLIILLAFGTVLALIVGAVIRAAEGRTVTVAFLDVGQGDAILIRRGAHQVLIDGGRSGTVLLERLGREMPFWDRRLEAVVATHPDEDHIGGLPALALRYRVGAWIMTDALNTTEAFRALGDAVDAGGTRIEAYAGMKIDLGDGVVLETLYPATHVDPNLMQDTNATSVVTRLTVGGKKFLFTGDLPGVDEALLRPGPVTVLKAGHHGSASSTTDFLLEETRPREAVLSVGADNTYGHPAPGVLARLAAHEVFVRRTDRDGTIRYVCGLGEESCRVEWRGGLGTLRP